MLSKLNESQKKYLPFECFTKGHYLSLEKMKFIRAEFRKMKASDPMNIIFGEFCSKYENRIMIDVNENSPSLITYGQALKILNESDNVVIKTIKSDIDGNENSKIEKTLKVRNDKWPLIVHVKKNNVDSAVVWNTMFNGGRIVIDN